MRQGHFVFTRSGGGGALTLGCIVEVCAGVSGLVAALQQHLGGLSSENPHLTLCKAAFSFRQSCASVAFSLGRLQSVLISSPFF